MEELVAELGSAFLCADLNITPEIRDDHVRIKARTKGVRNCVRNLFPPSQDLEALTGYGWASISARLRDLRKPQLGGYRVERDGSQGDFSGIGCSGSNSLLSIPSFLAVFAASVSVWLRSSSTSRACRLFHVIICC
jgi:hypothetical protein